MKSSIAEIPTIIGTLMGGGFYAGRINVDGQAFAIIVAPKEGGEQESIQWNKSYTDVTGANSFNDGLANTNAMLESGSELAKWARELRIADHDDWYIPSLDELEVIYRNLKPTDDKNYCWARSGINLNAITPTPPYTPDFPLQTKTEAFIKGGAEAFEPRWYWTSTQFASASNYAWSQSFYDGGQDSSSKSYDYRARAIRRLPI